MAGVGCVSCPTRKDGGAACRVRDLFSDVRHGRADAEAGSGLARQARGPAEQFEVASVKLPAPVPPSGGVDFGPARGGPGTTDPELIRWSYARLKDLLMTAYDVKAYQVIGPGWIDTERYDIVAKVPAGATKERVSLMWQSLLANGSS